MAKNKKKLAVLDNNDDDRTITRKKVEALNKGRWNVVQEMLQEVQANSIVEGKENVPLTQEIEIMKQAIKDEYKDEPETLKLLEDYMPGYTGIKYWLTLDGWDSAVMEKVRGSFKFSKTRRAKVMDYLFEKAGKGDTKAMELFLKISGDLESGKENKRNKEMDDYHKFNEILHRRKK